MHASTPDLTQYESMPTVIEMLYHWEQTKPTEVYLRQPVNGQYQEYTWGETASQVRKMAYYLKSLDLPAESNISILSKNCAHWVISDLAISMSGHISVPLYPNLTSDQLGHILTHSECKVLFTGKLDGWSAQKPGVPEGVHSIAMPLSEETDCDQWDDIIKETQPMEENYVPEKDSVVAILYTSGTTGSPKGVIQLHSTYQRCVLAASGAVNFLSKPHRFFSYLPLCHVAERNVVEICSLYNGGVISFVESIDTFVDNLQQTSPTIFFAVPRIWTKFQMGVLGKLSQSKLDFLFKIPIVSGLVKKKIRVGLGLNEAEYVVTAAAPCPRSLHQWYNNLGIQLQELYGMTENGGVCTIMRKEANKIGTVGQAYPGADIKIDEETQEVLMKADWIMKGYYKEPDMTSDVIKNGYLHTGDMGSIDSEGFLSITGRVKDTFKTSKGEFIVPGPIEWGFTMNTNVEQICVLGRNLSQPIAMVVLSDLGRSLSVTEMEQSLSATVADINKSLVNYERVFKTIIIKEPWSPENGFLTPTLKVKRNILEDRYSEQLISWHDTSDAVIWE